MYYLKFFLGFYFVLCSVIFFTQKSLLFFPSASHKAPVSWHEVVNNTHEGNKKGEVLGILKTQREQKKIAVIFHGNAGNANDRISFEYFFNGFNIFIVEYPGYGLNTNQSIDLNAWREQARQTMNYVLKDYSKEDVLIVGESLGTGPASLMAKEYHIPHLLLITPYTSLKELAQYKFWYLPAKYLLLYNFDNIEALDNYTGHVLIIAAQDDNVIAQSFAQKLFTHLRCEKNYILVLQAGHNSWSEHLTLEQKNQITTFFNGVKK